MRLIDADKFKKYISESYMQHRDELQTEKYRKLADEVTKGFLLDIDEQPTAYDVDMVVAKIQEKAGYFRDCQANYAEGNKDAYKDAIEIVKNCGISEVEH